MTIELGPNSWFIEEQYQKYKSDPTLVEPAWRQYFASTYTNGSGSTDPRLTLELIELSTKVERLLNAYRTSGHTEASLNPLTTTEIGPKSRELSPEYHNLSEADLNKPLPSYNGKTAKELIYSFQKYYTGTTGYQYMQVESADEREFLRNRIETNKRDFSLDEKKYLLRMLVEAEQLENELHKKYIGLKRFSIEGGEGFLALIAALFERSAETGITDIILGMAHRGRLATLCNILGKPLEKLFSEFEDTTWYADNGFGDVKYHLAGETTYTSLKGKSLFARLLPNPSHLETVNCVVEGVVRARQDHKYKGNRKSVLPVVVHGDSAFTGQGVVYECLNFSRVEGYSTGGTIHIAINNQVGFTATSDETRSSRYCTDPLLMINAPIFHVNGEDIEACAHAIELALDYRNAFNKDVAIDFYCYRKYGHNEGDDPTFTQPVIYDEIKKKTPVAKIFSQSFSNGAELLEEYSTSFKAKFSEASEKKYKPTPIAMGQEFKPVKTSVSKDRIQKIHDTLLSYPEGFEPHPKLSKILEKRTKAIFEQNSGVEWGVSEALTYGSLLQDGINVRLSGQDCGRGTFSHRHLALDDYKSQKPMLPLNNLGANAKFQVVNSTLSEYAVMGFEWGYAHESANTLVIWEAQFGDFANGAQIIIDQYLASAERKWGTQSQLTLLLPHGQEGQGPEHSSARIERYLQLCALGNMTVAIPTNSSQFFHLIRRQGMRETRRPLVVFTPKSLLRMPEAGSPLEDFLSGSFKPVISQSVGGKQKKNAPLIFVSGKISYDVIKALESEKISATIARVEELYPFPDSEVERLIKDTQKDSIYWVQEEPRNQGIWSYFRTELQERFNLTAKYVGRPESSQTAPGSARRHQSEQKLFIDSLVKMLK